MLRRGRSPVPYEVSRTGEYRMTNDEFRMVSGRATGLRGQGILRNSLFIVRYSKFGTLYGCLAPPRTDREGRAKA